MNHLQRCTALLFALLLAACTMQVSERGIVRPTPDPAEATTPEANFAGLPAPAQVHSILASDGTRLNAVWLYQPQAKLTVLHFGGNMSRISRNGRAMAERVLPLGANLLLVDHRGSGRSEGTPTLELMLGDALAAFDYLTTQLGVPADRVVVQGHSLGSFMAGHVARQRRIAGLVLSGSATTTEDWVATRTPWYAKPFLRAEIAPNLRGRGNLDVVVEQSAPLLLLCGDDDEQTPAKLTRKLAEAARANGHAVQLVIAEDAGHDDVWQHDSVQAAYRDFIGQVGTTAPQ